MIYLYLLVKRKRIKLSLIFNEKLNKYIRKFMYLCYKSIMENKQLDTKQFDKYLKSKGKSNKTFSY